VLSELGRWELLTLPRTGGEGTLQVRLLYELAKIQATFDDPNLVSRAGLVPVMALAQRAAWASWLEGMCGSAVRGERAGEGRVPGGRDGRRT